MRRDDDVLASILGSVFRQVTVEPDRVRVKLLRTNFELWFVRPDPVTAQEIRDREGAAYSIPVGMRLVNSTSGKDVRGLDSSWINPWWLRRFVFDLAAAVAYIEREWDVMSEEFVAKMESGQ